MLDLKFVRLERLLCVPKPPLSIIYIIITGNHLIFQSTNFKFPIKSNMTCDTLNCIYAIKWQECGKMYIEETSNLRLRTNVHRDHMPLTWHTKEFFKYKRIYHGIFFSMPCL